MPIVCIHIHIYMQNEMCSWQDDNKNNNYYLQRFIDSVESGMDGAVLDIYFRFYSFRTFLEPFFLPRPSVIAAGGGLGDIDDG